MPVELTWLGHSTTLLELDGVRILTDPVLRARFAHLVRHAPDPEMGEKVHAVVQPTVWDDAGPELERELLEHCRAQLAHYKCPKTIDFDPELPRQPTGKLYKRLLRDRYWGNQTSRIV